MQSICLTDLLKWTRFDYVLGWYSFGKSSLSLNEKQLKEDMCWWNQSIYVTCMAAELCYYIVLCFDLIVTLKRPFQNSSTRVLVYHTLSSTQASLKQVFITVLVCLSTVSQVESYCHKT
jgi:hypothetical protein